MVGGGRGDFRVAGPPESVRTLLIGRGGPHWRLPTPIGDQHRNAHIQGPRSPTLQQ